MRGVGCETPSFLARRQCDGHDPEFRKAQTNLKRPLLEIDSIYFLMTIEIDELRQRSKKMEGKAISRRQIRPNPPHKKMEKLGQFGTNFDKILHTVYSRGDKFKYIIHIHYFEKNF